MLHVCLDDSPRFTWIELSQSDSTNNFLRSYRPQTTVDLTLVTAEYQTAGRGQTGNRWYSDAAANLLCSYLFTPPADVLPSESFVINQAIALAVRDACQEFVTDAEVCVKWPNDIYVGEDKLAGILIETEMTGKTVNRVIAGIGINVNQTAWPPFPATPTHTPPTPTSLRLLNSGETLVRNVLEQLTGHLQRRLGLLRSHDMHGIREDYLAHLYRRTGLHCYADANGTFQATFHSIAPTGHLCLKDTSGLVRRYAFKEVSNVVNAQNNIKAEKLCQD